MKTILFVALIAFTAVNGYAQNKDCNCKKKTAYHHTTHKKSAVNGTRSTTLYVKKKETDCNTQSVVKDCPPYFSANNGCVYDPSGNITYVLENSYAGNYPRSIDINETLPAATLTVTSPAFRNFGPLPAKYTCEGDNASPPLNVNNIPSQTQSLAVIMYDPNATTNASETYWLIWDIDTAGTIPENFVNDHESMNVAREYGYHAACPASGTHYYHFMVYALDTKFAGGRNTTRAKLESAMRGHVLAKGELVGVYDRLDR